MSFFFLLRTPALYWAGVYFRRKSPIHQSDGPGMKKLRLIVGAVLLLGLTGCNTLAGLGRDLEDMGRVMQGQKGNTP